MTSVALVIGHKEDSPGACHRGGVCEFDFNVRLVYQVAELLRETSIKTHVVYRDTYKGLPEKINAIEPDLIIEFHCNAFNGDTSGTEVLYWHNSDRGKFFAGLLQRRLIGALGLIDRGIKAIDRDERGGYLLKHTKAPCVIAEPFFIDNSADLQTAYDNFMNLADAYAAAITDYKGV